MERVTGVVESKRRDGNAIRVNGEWYGTFKGKGLESVNWKDNVEFLFEKDKSGRYNNIKGTVKVVSKAPAEATSAHSGGRPIYSNLGVELGHASKLAWDLVIQLANRNGGPGLGSADFYKLWVEHTEKVFRAMKGLRSAHEKQEESKVVPAKSETSESPFEEDDDVEDPFA